MKGMVCITSFESLHKLDLSPYSIRLHITRSIKQGIMVGKGFVHVPHLSPSLPLFFQTKDKWKKFKFTDEEKEKLSKGNTGTWYDLYEESFIKEAKERKDFQQAYRRLRERLDTEENAILVCYCENKDKCHRGIVGHFLEEDGYQVIYQ
ncbi:DUF488 family protein [Bacillus sp. NPDC094106]|uniref:DUF488 family protein, N3 subclade n=1 Tax=Bacillus sp. NPDC094106 TaxID=3363949 RepID=UPI00381510F8